MGIQGYNKWLQREFKPAFLPAHKRQPRRYDHVYVDVNNLLHVAAHHSNSERTFFKKLFFLLDNRLNKTNPRHSVTLALDGPAPMAKTITQRRRRIRLSSGSGMPLSGDVCKLLKIGITPGSVLALKIDRALEYYVARRMLRKDRNGEPMDSVLYEISSMRVAGEGEIKLVKSIQQRLQNPRFQGHSHCIVTEDSDALCLAITLFGQGKQARYASNEAFQVYVLSGNVLFSARWFDKLLLSSLPKGASLDSARRDFIGLSAMMGNDYIQASKLGAKSSWNAYLEMRGTYLYRDDPLFPMPSRHELKAATNSRKNREKNEAGIETAVNWPFLRQLALKLIEPRLVKKVPTEDPQGRKKSRVYEYLSGVEWMLNMYYQGECTDFSFYCDRDGPEKLLDFLALTDEYDVTCDPLRDQNRAEASFYNSRPITPLAYSLAVIPRGGRAQLSRNLRRLVDPGSPIRQLFMMDYCTQCIHHRMHVSPMENALQNTLASKDPGFAEVVLSNSAFSRYSRYTDDEGYIIHPDTGEYMSMDEVREEVKKLNQKHLRHLQTAKQHTDNVPICLPTLEATVARQSADGELTEDEEILRTLATPVLFWRHSKYDPEKFEMRDIADEAELAAWREKIIPEGARPLEGNGLLEIRKFDGDVEEIMRAWGHRNDFYRELDKDLKRHRTELLNRKKSKLDDKLQRARNNRAQNGASSSSKDQPSSPRADADASARSRPKPSRGTGDSGGKHRTAKPKSRRTGASPPSAALRAFTPRVL